MTVVSIREFRKNLALYLKGIEKEEIEISKRGLIVAKLIPNGVYTKKKEITEVGVHRETEFPTAKIKPKIITKVEEVKEAVISSRGICKVCGAGLNPFGDFCMGKQHHKQ